LVNIPFTAQATPATNEPYPAWRTLIRYSRVETKRIAEDELSEALIRGDVTDASTIEVYPAADRLAFRTITADEKVISAANAER